MSQHDDDISLKHMLIAARESVNLIGGKSRSCLDDERVLFLALVRLTEIIGEAANRISSETQKNIPSIPWSEIIGMRNRLIHGYDNVDKEILWQVLTNDIPKLVSELEKINI